MIEAKHNKIFRIVFNLYIDSQLKKHFHKFFFIGELPNKLNYKSLLVLPNHFSWWDGFFVDLIYRKFFRNYEIYMMVLEETVKNYWFFNQIGAFSINQNSPKDILKSFEYANKLLNEEKNFVVIFPQGELKPYSTNVEIRPGIFELILKNSSDFELIFLAMKIQYENLKKPNVYFKLSEIRKSNEYSENPEKLEKDFVENLNLLENEIRTSQKFEIKI
jgi:1-acyl-sn-glycerol-3-phosphate acyltransferase